MKKLHKIIEKWEERFESWWYEQPRKKQCWMVVAFFTAYSALTTIVVLHSWGAGNPETAIKKERMASPLMYKRGTLVDTFPVDSMTKRENIH